MRDVRWDAADGVLIARLSGAVSGADVARWGADVLAAAAAIPDGTSFRLLADLSGYAPASLDAHRAMRTVIPTLLAEHGFRSGLVDMAGAAEPALRATRGIVCIAVAHVHHEPGTVSLYEERVGRATERFFTDPDAARAWLRRAPAV